MRLFWKYTGLAAGLICVLFFESCRFDFEQNDIEFLQVYDEGDTILFQNTTGRIDSFRIAKKSVYSNGWNEGMGGKYNSPVCLIEYENIPQKESLRSFGSAGSVYSSLHPLIFAIKKTPTSPLDVDLRFEGFRGNFVANTKPETSMPYGENYEVLHFCINCDGLSENNVIKIIWNTNEGITSYVKKDGMKWNRVRQ